MTYSLSQAALATRRTADVKVSAPLRSSQTLRVRHRELELKFASLQKDYAELHSALVEAAQVYRRLCAPHIVRYADFEIASEIFAVRHVPGDFFTLGETSDGVVLALGDICGKGLAAGMWTTHLVGLVSSRTAVFAEPRAIASGVNRDLCHISPMAPLASLFVAKLDPQTGRLDYCSAGHPAGLLLRSDGHLERLTEGGPLLGVVPSAPFSQGRVQLETGDVLLICSDGILESFNAAEEEFGSERLEAELRKARGRSADSMLFSVLGAVQDFCAPRPLTDDMTLAIVRQTARGDL